MRTARRAQAEEHQIVFPPLWPHQKTFVDDPAQFTVCKSATKCGKTMAAAWWLAREVVLDASSEKPGGLFWWIGPTNEVGLIGYLTVLHLLESIVVKKQERPWKFKVEHGATVALKTAQEPEFLRGPGVKAMVLDEAGTPDFDKAWPEIRTTITKTRGRLKIIGNPGDAGQFLDKVERWGSDPLMPEWSFHRWRFLDRYQNPAWDAETAREEWALGLQDLDQAARELGDDSPEFRRYYMGETIHGAGSFFHNLDAVCTAQAEEPIPGEGYLLGGDPCIKSDFVVGSVFKIRTRTQVYYTRHKGTPPEQQEEEFDRVARLYNDAPIVLEVNGPGGPIARNLMIRGRTVYPFDTTKKSKPETLYDYRSDIAHSAITLLNDEYQKREHIAYQMRTTRIGTVKFGSPHGGNDDMVMANAIANNGLRRAIVPEIAWVS